MKSVSYEKDPDEGRQPHYARWGETSNYACFLYADEDRELTLPVVHGRMAVNGSEVVGVEYGEEAETDIGRLVWRGERKESGLKPESSTGWMFLESFSGPMFIRDETVRRD